MENTSIKKSFAPIINKSSQILILGSLPSDKSIALNEYYGNKTNFIKTNGYAIRCSRSFSRNFNDNSVYM